MKKECKKAELDTVTIFWLIVSIIILVLLVILIINSKKEGLDVIEYFKSRFILWR